MARRKRRTVTNRLRLVAGLTLLTAFVVSLAAVVALRWLAPPLTMVMWLEPGSVADLDYRWVDRADIARAAAEAVIAAEDQRFLAHHGFDFDQMSYAIAAYRAGAELRGASTISQQVAKNVFLWNGRSLLRKVLEAYFTLLIELAWPKERILEVYLNVAELGPGVFGVEAAAERFFGTDASGLARADAALLAAVLPSPKRMNAAQPSVYVWQRQIEILAQMDLLDERGHYRGLQW